MGNVKKELSALLVKEFGTFNPDRVLLTVILVIAFVVLIVAVGSKP